MKKLICGTGSFWPVTKKALQDLNPNDEFIGIDLLSSFKPDIVRDILRGLPFNDNEFDWIEIHHVLEHISGQLACEPMDNFKFVMNELYRVLKPSGIVDIEVPYWRDDIAIESSGHIRFFAENSFINFYQNIAHKELGMSQFSKVVKNEVVNSQRSGERPARVLKIQLQK